MAKAAPSSKLDLSEELLDAIIDEADAWVAAFVENTPLAQWKQ